MVRLGKSPQRLQNNRKTASRLVFDDPTRDRLFVQGLEAIDQMIVGSGRVCSILVAARDDRVPTIVHLLPVTGSAQDNAFASAPVTITPVKRGAVPNG